MTGDEVRALCLALPETTEKETWADEANPGHPTFRIRDKIFVIMAVDGSGGSIRTSLGEQSDLMSAFPDAARSASYVGRYGWVDVDFDGIPVRSCARSSRAPGREPLRRSWPPPGGTLDDDAHGDAHGDGFDR